MTGSLPRQVFYGLAAAAGLIGTWFYNLRYDGASGTYVEAWFANAASSSAAVDLIVLAAVLSVFLVVEGRRVGMRRPWVYVLLGWVGAMAFAVPLFLLVRERTLDAEGRPSHEPRRPVH